MKILAVIDTNVIVAALLSKHSDSATVKILKELAGGRIIPLYHPDIIAEYEEVLSRGKFSIAEKTRKGIINIIKQFGLETEPTETTEILPDEDDLIFYTVALARRNENAYLITGNKKHYPVKNYIVTPSEMIEIMEKTFY